MNDSMHNLLVKVRIIGKIKEGQKLDTCNGLHVYNDGWINWFFRKWNRDNKYEGVRCIKDLYRTLEQTVDALVSETKRCKDDAKKSRNTYVMINTAIDIKNSINGLDNLTKTYIQYPSTTAAIEGILRDYVVVIYNTLLENIPKDKLPETLNENIIYSGMPLYDGIQREHKECNKDSDI